MSGNLVHFQSHTLARQNEIWMCRDTVYVGKTPPTTKLINPVFYRQVERKQISWRFRGGLCFNLMLYLVEYLNCWLLSS